MCINVIIPVEGFTRLQQTSVNQLGTMIRWSSKQFILSNVASGAPAVPLWNKTPRSLFVAQPATSQKSIWSPVVRNYLFLGVQKEMTHMIHMIHIMDLSENRVPKLPLDPWVNHHSPSFSSMFHMKMANRLIDKDLPTFQPHPATSCQAARFGTEPWTLQKKTAASDQKPAALGMKKFGRIHGGFPIKNIWNIWGKGSTTNQWYVPFSPSAHCGHPAAWNHPAVWNWWIPQPIGPMDFGIPWDSPVFFSRDDTCI